MGNLQRVGGRELRFSTVFPWSEDDMLANLHHFTELWKLIEYRLSQGDIFGARNLHIPIDRVEASTHCLNLQT